MHYKMKELSPDQFPFTRYDSGTIPASIYHSVKATIRWLSEQTVLGFIPGMKLEVRPSDIAVGILIDFGGYTTWAHLDDCVFEEYQLSAEPDQ